MFWKNIKAEEDGEPFKTSKEQEKETKSEAAPVLDERLVNAPKWIEIEGYKAVHFDMTSFAGKEQYTIRETKVCNSHISPCERGYHFGKTLEDVIRYYPPKNGTRYFKVRGLVPAYSYIDGDNNLRTYPRSCGRLMYEIDLIKYRKYKHLYDYKDSPDMNGPRYTSMDWKYVAKEITLLEEIPLEKIDTIESPFNSVIETKEEYYDIRTVGNFYKLAYKKWNDAAKDTFSKGLCDYIFYKNGNNALKSINSDYKIDSILNMYNKLIQALAAVKDEQISQDMRVMLFLKFMEE